MDDDKTTLRIMVQERGLAFIVNTLSEFLSTEDDPRTVKIEVSRGRAS